MVLRRTPISWVLVPSDSLHFSHIKEFRDPAVTQSQVSGIFPKYLLQCHNENLWRSTLEIAPANVNQHFQRARFITMQLSAGSFLHHWDLHSTRCRIDLLCPSSTTTILLQIWKSHMAFQQGLLQSSKILASAFLSPECFET